MKMLFQGSSRIVLLLLLLIFFAQSLRQSTRQQSDFELRAGRGNGFAKKVDTFPYTGRIRPGTLSPRRKIPVDILLPDYATDGRPRFSPPANNDVVEPTPVADIEKMRIAGRFAREILDEAVRSVRVGMTTDEIDAIVHAACLQRRCYPSPLNYHGYPKSVCTSVNEIICHGIPDSTQLVDGDIVNIDVTVFYQGVHGDCSETVLVGNVDDKVKDLVYTSYQSLKAAIDICKPGVKFSEIGGVIEDVVSAKGYSSAREFCGHGINSLFHNSPNVLHYRNHRGKAILRPGHTFTIEPMICLGNSKAVFWNDRWTAATVDGLPSAQFEHTLLITESGVEALTAKLPSSPRFFWE